MGVLQGAFPMFLYCPAYKRPLCGLVWPVTRAFIMYVLV
nr:MAG TPA: hypothetical protein [Caudoviricetes sp.]